MRRFLEAATLSEGELIARGARHAALRWTPLPLRHWMEDIIQDVVVYVLINRQHSPRVGEQRYRWGVQKAVRRLCYLLRGQSELAAGWDAPVEAPHELGPLPLWRLQRVWEDLTDLEREAVGLFLQDGSMLQRARELGCNQSALHQALRKALSRIDEPAAHKRGRSHRQRLDMTRERKPIDIEKIAALKARDAAAARARRAARRAA